ncbi:MAG: TetR/AcrR family transcriptional regulator [Frankiales bacterium]|nr:TetR/AcrR family transcriptional regulator [Frankiales bacterium]
MTEAAVRQRPGPKPRFTQDDLVDAALAVVDADGFGALSLRAVARELGVTSMAIYTYVASRDDLYCLVVDRLISTKLADFVWPEPWPDALRLFADNLSDLIDDHPALIEAFAQGQMRTAIAASVANQMLERLLAGGLPLRGAGTAYAAMHALVLGHAVLREAGKSVATGASTLTRVADDDDASALATYTAREGRLVDVTLHEMLELLIAGIEHSVDPVDDQRTVS